MKKFKLFILIILIANLLLCSTPTLAFDSKNINVVSYPARVNNSPVEDFSVKLRNKEQMKVNFPNESEFLYQVTYLYTPEYCSRASLQKQYPAIPYEFTCELNKSRLPFIFADIKFANAYAKQKAAGLKSNTYMQKFNELKITKNVASFHRQYLEPKNIYKAKLKVAPYYGDNLRIAKLWNEIFFMFTSSYDPKDYPYNVIDAFLGEYCYSSSWRGNCSYHRYNCIGNSHKKRSDLCESGNYFDMNQLSKLSIIGETPANELVNLFNTNLVLDEENNFLGLTYTVSEGPHHTQKIIGLDETSTQLVKIKDGYFKSRTLFWDTTVGKISLILLSPLAIIAVPVALYQMGQAGQ